MSHCPAGDPPIDPTEQPECGPDCRCEGCMWRAERAEAQSLGLECEGCGLHPDQCVCAEISMYNAALVAGIADEGDGYFEPPSEEPPCDA